MNTQKKKPNLSVINIPTANITNLISQYDVARLQLHQCAAHEYGDNAELDIEMSEKELSSLSKQEEVLITAASTPLRSEEDIKNLLQLWRREQPEHEDDMAASDQLVLTLYRHFNVVA